MQLAPANVRLHSKCAFMYFMSRFPVLLSVWLRWLVWLQFKAFTDWNSWAEGNSCSLYLLRCSSVREGSEKCKWKRNLTCALVPHCCRRKDVSFAQTVGITSSVMSLPSPHFLPVVWEIGVLSELLFYFFFINIWRHMICFQGGGTHSSMTLYPLTY